MSILLTTSSLKYVEIPNSPVYSNLSAYTVGGWFRPKSSGSSKTGIFWVKDPKVTYSVFLGFNGVDNELVIDQIAPTVDANSLVQFPGPFNSWYHIAVTFDINGDKKLHVYINGVEGTYNSQTAAIGDGTATSGPWDFGSDTFAGRFDGNIAEMAIWKVALTSGQVAALHASTIGASGISSANLVGYWHLCDATSPTPDATVNGNDGVIHGTITSDVDSPGFDCSAPTPVPPILGPVVAMPNVADKFVNPFGLPISNSTEGTAAPTAGGVVVNEFGQNPNGDGKFAFYEIPLHPVGH